MADIYYTGDAPAVAQIATVQVTAYDVATTYKLTVGDTVISTIAQGTVDATASALSTAWNASTRPYCTAVTASVATDTVTLTGDTAGVPFTVTSSVAGGAGTIGAVTTTTAATGPNHADAASNYSGGAAPTTSDNVTIDGAFYICWGLSALQFKSLRVTNKVKRIGLDQRSFATSSDALTVDTSVPEYRLTHLTVTGLGTNPFISIGDHEGPGATANLARCCIDCGSDPLDVIVFGSAATSSETGRPAVRIKANDAATDIYVKSCPGGFGLAMDTDADVSVVGDVTCSDATGATKMYIGDGTTWTNLYADGGNWVVRAAATATLLRIGSAATVETRGDYTITTATNNGGTFYPNQIKTSGNAITTLNHNDGTTDGTKLTLARTFATVNLARDFKTGAVRGKFIMPDAVTQTATAYTGGSKTSLG